MTAGTLVALNTASRAVYEDTLPVMYEWMSLEWEGYFEKIVPGKCPRGWRHTK